MVKLSNQTNKTRNKVLNNKL